MSDSDVIFWLLVIIAFLSGGWAYLMFRSVYLYNKAKITRVEMSNKDTYIKLLEQQLGYSQKHAEYLYNELYKELKEKNRHGKEG
jgi:hypothetical protein